MSCAQEVGCSACSAAGDEAASTAVVVRSRASSGSRPATDAREKRCARYSTDGGGWGAEDNDDEEGDEEEADDGGEPDAGENDSEEEAGTGAAGLDEDECLPPLALLAPGANAAA